MPPTDSLPAPGQGALGIEIAAGRSQLRSLLAPLVDRRSWLEVTAERSVSRALGGSCRIPLAAYAVLQSDGTLQLDALLATDGVVRRTSVRTPRAVSPQSSDATVLAEGLGPDYDAAEALGEQAAVGLA